MRSRSKARRVRRRISPICTRGPKCICRVRAGSGSTPPPDCWRARGTFRWRPRPTRVRPRPFPATWASAKFEFRHEMSVTRVHEDPRVTLPYTEQQWKNIDRLGRRIDQRHRRARHRADHGRRADFRLHRQHGRGRMEHRRPRSGETAAAPASSSSACARAWPRAVCSIPGRVNGIPASLCRAGRWPVTGAPTDSRCGATAHLLAARRYQDTTSARRMRNASRKRWRAGSASMRATSIRRSKTRSTTCSASGSCR